MVNAPKKQSAYADYLYNKVEEWIASGRAGFTIKQIAEFSGLKPTGNLRRRINHCVEVGTLAMIPALNGTRGSVNVYFKNDDKHGVTEKTF